MIGFHHLTAADRLRSARRVAQRDVGHRASGATTPTGRYAATLRAGRFWPLASLACTCGGVAPRPAIRLARDQNRHGQMAQSNHNSLYTRGGQDMFKTLALAAAIAVCGSAAQADCSFENDTRISYLGNAFGAIKAITGAMAECGNFEAELDKDFVQKMVPGAVVRPGTLPDRHGHQRGDRACARCRSHPTPRRPDCQTRPEPETQSAGAPRWQGHGHQHPGEQSASDVPGRHFRRARPCRSRDL